MPPTERSRSARLQMAMKRLANLRRLSLPKHLTNRARSVGLALGARELTALLALPTRGNLMRLLRAAEWLCPDHRYKQQIAWLHRLFEQNHPATRLALRLLQEANPNVRRCVIKNLFLNNIFVGRQAKLDFKATHGFLPPSLIVISPTMRCNLKCYGCYAWKYSKQEELSAERFDQLLTEAQELGIYFVTISGGEPFLYEPLLDTLERHSDQIFQIYTNGTCIDEAVAKRLGRLGNVVPAISVEGLQKETDDRRGPGTFERICHAMDCLRQYGCVYGFSNTATRRNTDIITSPEFIDFWVEKGCYFGWFFTYIPIGRDPNLDLMQTVEQRDRLRSWTLEIRRTRPIFVADFWNDGHLTGGCMAGGRMYLHINHRGDVEPCVFAHFAVDNIHRTSLRQALTSDFFRHIREQIPYNENVLRPCMIIDNPHVLREAVHTYGAQSTDGGGQSLLEEIAPQLDEYAAKWGEVADRAWAEGYEWAKPGGLLCA